MDQHESHDGPQHAHGHPHHDSHHLVFDTAEMAERTELEGEVLAAMTQDAITAIAQLCAANGVTVERLVDVGCGPGVATCLLAAAFPEARVVAADGSPSMLDRARRRADEQGVGHRVEVRTVALPGAIATLGQADVVWASMVLHHVGDEIDALRRLGALLAPGGVLAVVEREGPVRVLPDGDDLGRPGLSDRLDATWDDWFEAMRAGLPGTTASGAYATMIEAAGLELTGEVVLSLQRGAPLDDQTLRFARGQLESTRSMLEGRVAADDLVALDDARHGAALELRAARRLYLARVPDRRPA